MRRIALLFESHVNGFCLLSVPPLKVMDVTSWLPSETPLIYFLIS